MSAVQTQRVPAADVSTSPSNPISAQEQERLQTALDNGIWYALMLWQSLAVAVQNGWGGSETLEKRDWFAGAVSSLLTDRVDTDQEDIEVFLLQIMDDEFDCRVEDETEIEVARQIIRLRNSLMEDRDLGVFYELEQRWKNRGQMKGDVRVNDQTDQDDELANSPDFDDDQDIDMDEAPALAGPSEPRVREKVEPEVDDDGFTKVVGKKKR